MSTKVVALVFATKIETDDAKKWLHDRFNVAEGWTPGQLTESVFVTLETLPSEEQGDGTMAAGLIASNFQNIVNAFEKHLG